MKMVSGTATNITISDLAKQYALAEKNEALKVRQKDLNSALVVRSKEAMQLGSGTFFYDHNNLQNGRGHLKYQKPIMPSDLLQYA